jgi:hypothetical protein
VLIPYIFYFQITEIHHPFASNRMSLEQLCMYLSSGRSGRKYVHHLYNREDRSIVRELAWEYDIKIVIIFIIRRFMSLASVSHLARARIIIVIVSRPVPEFLTLKTHIQPRRQRRRFAEDRRSNHYPTDRQSLCCAVAYRRYYTVDCDTIREPQYEKKTLQTAV